MDDQASREATRGATEGPAAPRIIEIGAVPQTPGAPRKVFLGKPLFPKRHEPDPGVEDSYREDNAGADWLDAPPARKD